MRRIQVLAADHYPQIVIALSVLALSSINFFQEGIFVLFPFIREDLKASRAELGLIGSGMLLGGTATSLVMGWLADKIGLRRLLPVTLLAVAAGVLAFSRTQSLVQAVLLAAFIGVAAAATGPSNAKAIMDWIRPRARSLSMGIVQTSVPISGITVAAVLPVLAEAMGWRNTVMVVSLAIALSSIVYFSFYRDNPSLRTQGAESKTGGTISQVLKNRDIWLAAFSGATLTGMYMVVASYLILYLQDTQGMSAVQAGGFLALAHAGSGVGRILWGTMSDYLLGGRRAMSLALLNTMAISSLALASWVPSDTNLVLVGAMVIFMGATTLGWSGLHVTFVAELAGPGLTGTTMGFSSVIYRVLGFGVAPLFGLIVDRTGSYDPGWWMVAGIVAFGILLLAFIRPQARGQLQAAPG